MLRGTSHHRPSDGIYRLISPNSWDRKLPSSGMLCVPPSTNAQKASNMLPVPVGKVPLDTYQDYNICQRCCSIHCGFQIPRSIRRSSSQRTQTKKISPYGGCFRPVIKILSPQALSTSETSAKANKSLPVSALGLKQETCSDEVVAQPTNVDGDRILLFGFNEENPFFSANHMFYTTTWSRAIDPVAAIRINSWPNVGRLQIGHMLLGRRMGSSMRLFRFGA